MKNIFIFICAALVLSFSGFSHAAEKSRADVESAIDANKLSEYNAQKMAETLTDISDSTLNKLSDGIGFFNICGEATTVNNNTVYYGPNKTLTANTMNGQACDINAAGSTTEATADDPIYTNKAFKVQGMTCRNQGDANANISFTLRTAAGATVPSVACTIADGERDCVADVGTSTDIAAGATVAIAAASTGNIANGNGFVCTISTTF
jgi:hypothetical protein